MNEISQKSHVTGNFYNSRENRISKNRKLVKTGQNIRPRQWAQGSAAREGAPACDGPPLQRGGETGGAHWPFTLRGVGTSAAGTLAKDRSPEIGLSAAAMAEWLRRWT